MVLLRELQASGSPKRQYVENAPCAGGSCTGRPANLLARGRELDLAALASQATYASEC
jgi:hypothetical protein